MSRREVASLELSKRLYELSGWDDTRLVHQELNGRRWVVEDEVALYPSYPAYELGYLIRKLPAVFLKYYSLTITKRVDDTYSCCYADAESYIANKGQMFTEADTAENTLGLLAIKLFEEGVLKK
jgi:hypothetical protein